MNHDCSGDIFTRFGKRWGRCFGGGEIFELREGMQFCPSCNRPWLGSEGLKDWDPDECEEVLRTIDLPHYKFLAEERARMVKHLEQQLETWKKMYKDKAGITAF